MLVFPLSFLMRIGKFGAGHHSGATFPMKKFLKKIHQIYGEYLVVLQKFIY